MEGTNTPTAVTAQETPPGTDPQPAAAGEQDSPSPHRLFAFEDIFEDQPIGSVGGRAPAPAPVSNEGTTAATPEAATTPAAEPADEGTTTPDGVSATETTGDAPPAPSRREAERIAHETRIAELEAEVQAAEERGRQAYRDEQAAEAERQRQAQLTAEERAEYDRYERLLRTPTHELTSDDRDWLEERKYLVSHPVYQSVERHLRAQITQEVARERENLNTQAGAFWDAVYNELEGSTKLDGVDSSKWRENGHTWGPMAQNIYDGGLATGAARKEAELMARVEAAEAAAETARKEAEALRLQAATGQRAPRAAGQPSGGPTEPAGFDPRRSWRANLTEALSEPATNGVA